MKPQEDWLVPQLNRWARIAPMLLMLVLPWMGWTAFTALSRSTTDILEWIPSSSTEVSSLNWFDQHFGTDQILVVSWEGATIDNPQVIEVSDAIKALRTASGKPLFRRLTSGSQIFDYLTGSLKVERGMALDRLDGWLSGPEGATAVAAVIGNAGAGNPSFVVDSVRRMVAEVTALPPEQIRIAGTTADGVAVKAASTQWVIELAVIAIIVAIGFAVLALGGIVQALPVLLSALTSALASLSAMHFFQLPVDGLSVMVPVLGFVLTASVTLHLDGYHRTFGSGVIALSKALRAATWPTSIALITTFLGFASLAISETIPIQRFAVAACITIVIVAFVCWLVWPAVTLALGVPGRITKTSRSNTGTSKRIVSERKTIFAVAMLAAFIAIAGLPRLDTSFGIDRLLRGSNPLIQDYQWFEANIGDVVPVEVVVRMKSSGSAPDSQYFTRVQAIGQARQQVRNLPHVSGVIAADSFMPTDQEIRANADATTLQQRSDAFKRRSQAFSMLAQADNGGELWRISARVSAFDGLDFQHLDETLGQTVREALADNPDVIDVRVMGGLPMVARAQQQLLRDLLLSFGIALGVLSLGFALLLRSLRTGLLIIIPNVLPVTLVFGFLGWAGSPIDIGLVMTASAALGLAVDDSAHLLVSFNRARQAGESRAIAAETALMQISPAAIRTSLLCGIPMAVFAASPFLPAARFGLVMAILIGVALIVDLVVMPALLSRFGTARRQIAENPDSS